ncbi:MFS transporter [Pseudomonas matsuisoli]|uniref:Sugar transporter n=1 Tax=Pseudomonas matsuisoli TaxID=1515666 RepID=A0A917PLI5_9PSED|nr:MFS transporter [Pseudomonas matsuisoli]GGJ83876.1 sugar transporter [Pseudomonas matsuisoli]
MSQQTPHHLSRWLVLLMAVATGIAVASNYYNQPLLHTIADRFGLSFSQAGIIVTTAQVSYAAGLLLLVPLGDLLERRRLIVSMTVVAAVGLGISASANSIGWLLLGTTLTGLFSVVAQVLVPFAATLASPEERGRVVGTVMSGLILGILLARTVAGALSEIGDWRTVYILASILMLATAVALRFALPHYHQSAGLSYPGLLRSVFTLLKEEPVHRLRTFLGGLGFAIFAIFWTPLAFLLSSEPYGYSDGTIGLFGLAGAVGALAANVAGRMADKGKGTLATTIGLVFLTASWLPLVFAQSSLAALLIGVVVLDLAVQLSHVSNQNVVYKLRPEARSRLNAGYMTGYFLGGSLGSLLSAALYQHFGWPGVCAAGFTCGAVALVTWMLSRRPATDRGAVRT